MISENTGGQIEKATGKKERVKSTLFLFRIFFQRMLFEY
jgi:hypothetical protein